MKTYHTRSIRNLRLPQIAAIVLCCLATASADNIVTNGSFELLNNFGLPLYWTPVGTFVNWANAPDGHNYVELDPVNTSVSQNLTTVPGLTYSFSFYAAGDAYLTPSSTIEIDLGGQSVELFTTTPRIYDPTQNRALQVVWQQFSGTATASSTSSLLTISALNGSAFMLDAVQMTPVPEPASFSLMLAAASSTSITIGKRRPKERCADVSKAQC